MEKRMTTHEMIVPVLLYHRIYPAPVKNDPYHLTVAHFERQMAFLHRQGYTTLSLPELEQSQWGDQREILPEKPLIITFDDGSRDNYTHAFPVLDWYGFQATIFMLPKMAGKTDPETGISYLSWDEVMALRDRGFDFQSHGLSHRPMTSLSHEVLRRELSESRAMLEAKLTKEVRFLAYPLGLFDGRVQAMAREAGYHGACGGSPELDGRFPNRFAIGRTEIFKTDSQAHFRFKLRHGHSYYYYYKKRLGRKLKSYL